MVENEKLDHLLRAARAVSPHCEIRFRGTDVDGLWICLVCVGDATIFESKPGDLAEVIDAATAKMKGVSQRMFAALNAEEPPSSKDP